MKPIEQRLRPWLGSTFPPGWKLVHHSVPLAATLEQWVYVNGTRQVMVSEERHPDGRRWLHGSISVRRGHIRYEDLLYLRRHWLGHDWPAVQFFPTEEAYVNLHENCLHLWVCLSGDPEWVEEGACAASA